MKIALLVCVLVASASARVVKCAENTCVFTGKVEVCPFSAMSKAVFDGNTTHIAKDAFINTSLTDVEFYTCGVFVDQYAFNMKSLKSVGVWCGTRLLTVDAHDDDIGNVYVDLCLTCTKY